MKITNLEWHENVLSIKADVFPGGGTLFQLKTPLRVVAARGATVRSISDQTYELTVLHSAANANNTRYQPSEIEVTFADSGPGAKDMDHRTEQGQ
jgi:hypothetical protein